MAKSDEKPTCFIAMPITTQPEHVERYNGDADHWGHVMSSLFEKAIEEAGFRPIRPAAQGSHLIHAQIIRHLSTADLVLVDLSTHNPNVFFELGVRTSLDLPIALVRDEHTNIPFDTSGINTYEYDSNLRGWELEEQRNALMQHVAESHASCAGKNPLWQQFGLKIRASEPDSDESPREAKLDLIVGQLARLQNQMDNDPIPPPGIQVRFEDSEAVWTHQDKPRRSDLIDHVLENVREILVASNPSGRRRIFSFDRIGLNSVEVAADFLSDSEIAQIRKLEQSSGVEIKLRPRSEARTVREQRSKSNLTVAERRKRDLNEI